ncbi:PstS family phosphate ABC transporter substrate-binding protein [Bacillus sp. CECT 9360]|uniref:PstS family phosphate ABC transporter substrate-binding protein n=1 Tax=Bacillus sp. CECT 9360 TaxID=2845821 RepID=UPI001E611D73|nr:PstS family phosphate ABC transporter substrate-binding protein [Bacillus sp. CECT 9360]CAH0347473.1 Phosphate-binding protein PstS [Bacillus sp. CECT 9360]
MKTIKYFALLALLLISVSGCGNQGENNNGGNGEGGGDQLQGNVSVDGSSTVYPIMEAIVEEYMAEQPEVKVSVGTSGTGGGFESFAAGDTQLANASRPIKEEEKAALKKNGIDYTEFRLAFDGLSVAVNKDNDWVDHLTIEELRKMWLEDGSPQKWSDIREGWPDEEIQFYSPGTDSGTFDYFNEIVLEEKPMVEGATLSEDDNILVQGVKGEKHAIGFFGYAYYVENKDDLKVVPIDGGKGPVEPNNETIKSGEYAPLSRPLFTYANNAEVKENKEVYDFLRFTIENSAEFSEDVGYVRLPKEEYEADMDKLEALK